MGRESGEREWGERVGRESRERVGRESGESRERGKTSTFPDHARFNGLMQLLQSQWPDMYRIAEQCTQKSPDERPTMQNVISQLDSLIAAETQ